MKMRKDSKLLKKKLCSRRKISSPSARIPNKGETTIKATTTTTREEVVNVVVALAEVASRAPGRIDTLTITLALTINGKASVASEKLPLRSEETGL